MTTSVKTVDGQRWTDRHSTDHFSDDSGPERGELMEGHPEDQDPHTQEHLGHDGGSLMGHPQGLG